MYQNNINDDTNFSTSSLALAAAISLSCPLMGVNHISPSRLEFVFKKNERLGQLVDMFWKRELKVEVQEYFSQLKFLKTRIYEAI